MLLVNKMCAIRLPQTFFVSSCQLAFCTITLLVLVQFQGFPLGDWDRHAVQMMLVYTAAFGFSIYASMRSLQANNIETVIVFRCCAPMLVALAESYLTKSFSLPIRSVVAVLILGAGACAYAFTESQTPAKSPIPNAYLWTWLYTCSVVFLMIHGKTISSLRGISLVGTVLFSNAFALVPMTLGFYLSGESIDYNKLGTEEVLILLASCIVGTTVSFSGWWCREQLSATAYTLVGTLNKISTELLNILIWDHHASMPGVLALSVCLAGGFLYDTAPRSAEHERPVKFSFPLIRVLLMVPFAALVSGGVYGLRLNRQTIHRNSDMTQHRLSAPMPGNVDWNVASTPMPRNVRVSATGNTKNLILGDSMPVRKTVVVWTNDFHISTIGNVKKLLQGDGVTFVDKSLSGHCHVTGTCATDLKVLNQGNGISPDTATRRQFADAYANDTQFSSVDIVMCFHPSAMCELFMPMGKRLFVIATTRYEMGRESIEQWSRWNTNLVKIAADKRNVVAANNQYDAKYIEFFTGISPLLLPSFIAVEEKYSGTSSDILVAEMHSRASDVIMSKLKEISPRLRGVRDKYKRYTFSQLCENSAIVHFPYQTSIMSLFEQYSMGIPVIVPTPEFLWRLHDQYDIVTERTWHRVRTGLRPKASIIAGKQKGVPDPNNDLSKEAFLHWVRYADFYQWKHIQQFGSWDELSNLLKKSNWRNISVSMQADAAVMLRDAKKTWDFIL
jgi:hypothetical protein